jgi:uncharacterized membrane protein YfcA
MDIELLFIGVLVISALTEYMDATLGMGYGTTLAPILLLIGFSPMQVVPAILLAQFIAGIFAATLHHGAGNVSFDFKNDHEHEIVKRLGKLGYIPRSKDSKVALVLAVCSVIGVIVAVVVALNLPEFYLKLYIGILVLTMGIIVMIKHKARHSFSWKRIMGIGALASFNKGISGGGYGPLIVSGQILSGVNTKNSIGITALAEGVTCFVGVLAYIIIGTQVDWMLAPYLVAGSLISVPVSVYTVKRMPVKEFTLAIGMATALLGMLILVKLII